MNQPCCHPCGSRAAEHGTDQIHRFATGCDDKRRWLQQRHVGNLDEGAEHGEVAPSTAFGDGRSTVKLERAAATAYLYALHAGQGGEAKLDAGLHALRRLLPGCDHVSTTATSADGWRPVAATDDIARRADEVQGTLGEGPTVHALGAAHSVSIQDLRVETRWPRWCGSVINGLGLRAALVILLERDARPLGTLNLYSDVPGQLARLDVAVLHALAVPLSTVLLEAHAAGPGMEGCVEHHDEHDGLVRRPGPVRLRAGDGPWRAEVLVA